MDQVPFRGVVSCIRLQQIHLPEVGRLADKRLYQINMVYPIISYK